MMDCVSQSSILSSIVFENCTANISLNCKILTTKINRLNISDLRSTMNFEQRSIMICVLKYKSKNSRNKSQCIDFNHCEVNRFKTLICLLSRNFKLINLKPVNIYLIPLSIKDIRTLTVEI